MELASMNTHERKSASPPSFDSSSSSLALSGLGPVDSTLHAPPADFLSVTSQRSLPLSLSLPTPLSYHERQEQQGLCGVSALDLLVAQRPSNPHRRLPISSNCSALDRLLGEGMPIGQVTEFYGVPGIGKTQLSIQLACNAASMEERSAQAVYIDTEGSFLYERAKSVASGIARRQLQQREAQQHQQHQQHQQQQQQQQQQKQQQQSHAITTPAQRKQELVQSTKELLSNIYVYRTFDYKEQLECVRRLPRFLQDNPKVRLVVLDSVSFLFRRDFADMAHRSRLLMGLARDLAALAQHFGVAVMLTNQITTKVTEGRTSYLAPALGDSWLHLPTNRIHLYWEDEHRCARLEKSPFRPVNMHPAVFEIASQGVQDANPNAQGGADQIARMDESEVDGDDQASQVTQATSGGGYGERSNRNISVY